MCLGKWVLGMIKEAKQLRLTKKGKQSARKMGRGGGGREIFIGHMNRHKIFRLKAKHV